MLKTFANIPGSCHELQEGRGFIPEKFVANIDIPLPSKNFLGNLSISMMAIFVRLKIIKEYLWAGRLRAPETI